MNIKANKIRRFKLFRLWFLQQRARYTFTSVNRCLIGLMIAYVGGGSTNGNFDRDGLKVAAKYFGLEANRMLDIGLACDDIWKVSDYNRDFNGALAVIDALIAEKSVDPNKLVIEVTENDAQKAGDYYDGDECLLATTLKRMFPKSKISVSGYSFSVDGVFYRMTEEESSKPLRVYVASREKVDMKKFKPFTVTGTKKA